MKKSESIFCFILIGYMLFWQFITIKDINDMRREIKDMQDISAHHDQSIDYLLRQDSIAHPQNWKR